MATRKTRIRLGIAGLGMGLSHARACLAAKGVELAALADIDEGILEKKKERIVKSCGQDGYERLCSLPLYADYRRMFRMAELDAVLIALPTGMHTESSTLALECGLHVLCEKPPATSAADMAGVAELARSKGLTYMYARQQRFAPAKQLVRKLVDRGRLGPVYHAESKWIRSGGIPFRHGWGVNKSHGGGVLLDLGVHAIDDGWFLMGCPRPVEAFAALHCSFPHLGDGQNLEHAYDADDCATGTIRFANGASLNFTATFAMNTAGPHGAPLEGEGAVEWLELNVYGVRAGASIHDSRLTFRKGKTETVRVREIKSAMPKGKTELMLQLEHFAGCLLKGREVQNTPEQAVMLMQMLDALRESAETGRSVSIAAPANRKLETAGRRL
ncbi:MAG TPA: Gfo/Idh/MocA family oxidoreductase [Planctomycetota bacterium]|nr:Gfo/Idh/MocA family oxidoreductase [Planctomycetota bacterium]